MASSREYLEYVLEQTCGVELSYKKMMGEYLLYANGVLFGGIYDDRLLFKPTEKAKKMMPQAGLALPYLGAKRMLLCDFVDDGERLSKVIEEVTRE